MVNHKAKTTGTGSRRYDPYSRPGRNLPLRLQQERAQAAARQRAARTPQVEPQELTSTVPEQQTQPPEPRDGSESQTGGSNQRGGFGQSGGSNQRGGLGQSGGSSQRGGSQSQRGGSQGRGGHHGSSTRGAPKNDLQKVHSARMVEISDHQGLRRTKFVNTSIAGGNSNNWVAESHEGGVWGTCKDTRNMEFWGDQVKAMNNCNSVSFLIVPNDKPDFWNSVAKDEVERRTINNSGRDRESRPERLGEIVRSRPIQKTADSCPYCPAGAHTLERCIAACRGGEIPGCPICNNRSHMLDDCFMFQRMTLEEQVDWLVTRRANKPPFKTMEPWYITLHRFCMSDSYNPKKAEKGFPWSQEYALFTYEQERHLHLPMLQRRFDDKPGYRLPVDPATADFERIWDNYWKGLGLAWPTVLGNDDEAMADPDELVVDEGLVTGMLKQNGPPSPGLQQKSASDNDADSDIDLQAGTYGDPREDATSF